MRIFPVIRKSIAFTLIPPLFINCVVAIGIRLTSAAPPGVKVETWNASGFLYGEKVQDGYAVFLVTNEHVVKGLKKVLASPSDIQIAPGLPAQTAEAIIRFNPPTGGKRS